MVDVRIAHPVKVGGVERSPGALVSLPLDNARVLIGAGYAAYTGPWYVDSARAPVNLATIRDGSGNATQTVQRLAYDTSGVLTSATWATQGAPVSVVQVQRATAEAETTPVPTDGATAVPALADADQTEFGYAESGNIESSVTPYIANGVASSAAARSFLALPLILSPVPTYVTADLNVRAPASGVLMFVGLWQGSVELARFATYSQGVNLAQQVRLTHRLPPGDGLAERDLHVRFGPVDATGQVDLFGSADVKFFNRLRVTR